MVEPKIVVIEQAEKDDYDNVLLIDKDGTEHKIGKKRGETILNLVLNNEGKAVKLSYDSYKGHDYIANVELVSDQIKETPDAKPPQTLVNADAAQLDGVEPIVKAEPKTPPSESGQERGMWSKELGSWLMLGYKEDGTLKLSDLIGAENALDAARWYRSKLLSVNKIPFDGAKFPFIKKKEGE